MAEQQHVLAYLGLGGQSDAAAQIHWHLIRAACASVAGTAVHPMQDVLGLGHASRMNFPGQDEGTPIA